MELQGAFFMRLKQILKENKVEHDDKVLVKLIQRFYPDWRRLINECQRYASTGKIDAAILSEIADVSIDQLMYSLKNR